MARCSNLVFLVALAACEEHGSSNMFDGPGGLGDGGNLEPVGRRCASGVMLGDPTLIASPALDCTTRECLHVQGQADDMCTADCTTAADCRGALESPCGLFACTIATDVGPFACRRTCVCATQVPPGGFPVGCD